MPLPDDTVRSIVDFLIELDALKSVDRRTYINSGERLENSAEHSWHLAMACWVFAEKLRHEFDVEKLIKLALIHDIGEIDAGDAFLYGPGRDGAGVAERRCIRRLAGHKGNTLEDLVELWDEQELGKSKEAGLLKVIDRLLPFLLNISNRGRTWRENNVCRSQVLEAHEFIREQFPEIHAWMVSELNHAAEEGWIERD